MENIKEIVLADSQLIEYEDSDTTFTPKFILGENLEGYQMKPAKKGIQTPQCNDYSIDFDNPVQHESIQQIEFNKEGITKSQTFKDRKSTVQWAFQVENLEGAEEPKEAEPITNSASKNSSPMVLNKLETTKIQRHATGILSRRDKMRESCKNTLLISKPKISINNSSDKQIEEEPSQASLGLRKSYSVKSYNQSQAGDDDEDNKEMMNEGLPDFDKINVINSGDYSGKMISINSKDESFNRKSLSDDPEQLEKVVKTPNLMKKFSLPAAEVHKEQAFEDLYTTEDYLGEGCSSVVKICRLAVEPFTRYAVKIMRVPDKELYDMCMREFNLLEELNGHPNIIRSFDIFYNTLQEKIYILMEYAGDGSDLHKYIKNASKVEKQEGQYLTEEAIAKIIRALLDGIQFIHQKGVCHRDIKPSNIYITKDLESLKILDFNVAVRFTSSQKLFGVTGEQEFSAPELSSGQNYDERVDVWSTGIVLYLILSRGKKLKFFPYDEPEEIQEVVNKKISKLQCSAKVKDALHKMLVVKQEERINASDALQIEWLRSN